MLSKKKIQEIRTTYHVDISNEFLRTANINLTLSQYKLLNVLWAFVKLEHAPGKEYEINISDICAILGYVESGYYYKSIKADFLKLCESKNGGIRCLKYAKTEQNNGQVKYCFSNEMEKHIFGLGKENPYTEYSLMDVIAFRHKSSIRIFQILKSKMIKRNNRHISKSIQAAKQECIEFDLDYLKKAIGAKGYLNAADFVKRCILPALEEINLCNGEYNISIETVKKGVKTTGIIFKVGLKYANRSAAKEETIARLTPQTRRNRFIEKIKTHTRKIINIIRAARKADRKRPFVVLCPIQ